MCSIHETLPDALPVSRIREDDTIVVYERRPLVVAPQEEDRLEDEPADSNVAGDFRVRTDADGTTVVRVTASCRCSLWCHVLHLHSHILPVDSRHARYACGGVARTIVWEAYITYKSRTLFFV